MSIYFPGTGTKAKRATDAPRVGRGVTYMPKIVPGPKWWQVLIPEDESKKRRH